MNQITFNSEGEPRDGWVSNNPMFKSLTKREVLEFQQWAHDNFDSEKNHANPLYHPVIRAEFQKIASGRVEKKTKSIKDVLIFRKHDVDGNPIYYAAFPWDTNPQAGTICFCICNEGGKIKDGWCMVTANPYLGERINYVDLISDSFAAAIRTKVAEYNTKEK